MYDNAILFFIQLFVEFFTSMMTWWYVTIQNDDVSMIFNFMHALYLIVLFVNNFLLNFFSIVPNLKFECF